MATIHTKKNTYQTNQQYQEEKAKLFKNLTINMLLKELKNNDIEMNEKEVVSQYRKTYNFNALIDVYHEKYDKELDALGAKEELFDDDAIVYLCIKVIEKNFDIHSVPDIDYIAEDLQYILHHECDDATLLKQVNKQIKRINKASKYIEEKNLQALFEQYEIDLEQFFTRAFSIVSSASSTQKVLEELYAGLVEMHGHYTLSLRYGEITARILARIIKEDETNCKHVETIINMYPNLTLNTYYSVLEALQQCNKQEFIQQYVEKALAYVPKNEAERDFQGVIQQVFGD